jgi:hypothetical protein
VEEKVRFVEFPSADEKKHLIVNVEEISHVEVIRENMSSVTRIFFRNGVSVDAQVVGKDVDALVTAMELRREKKE